MAELTKETIEQAYKEIQEVLDKYGLGLEVIPRYQINFISLKKEEEKKDENS